ncbi:DUF58 domain-containing protein [Alkalihalobacillus pseudalcaliphilus]|uniref:DUF58 domain-containing protein n=1 Tax=Alkalihalobacillus pseudalcaliphilus TaxID=79884 RepID=UPI00064D9821|nr:DUF58 domain-containing protein [Alkalihalobacillus pseudalcaliphilus]KMK74420.1 hypothetical protein AB990_21165 [Alkalihalobacillus pseudalcaliphilus]
MKKVKVPKALQSTLKIILLIVTVISVFAYAMFQGQFVAWFLFYSVITVIGITLLFFIMPFKGFEVSRIIQPDVVKAGDHIQVDIHIRKKSYMPFFYMRVRDRVVDHLGDVNQSGAFFFFTFQKEFTYSYTIHEVKRGQFEFEYVELYFGDLFGFFEKKRVIACQTMVHVYPRYQRIQHLPHSKQTESIEGKIKTKELGEERNLSTVRHYIPGDKLTSIDWKQSARSMELMTKEFESFRGEGVVIVYDPYVYANDEKVFEKSIELAASILVTFLASQSSVTLSVRLEDWVVKEISANHLYKGLEIFSEVKGLEQPLSIDKIYDRWLESTVYFVCAELTKETVQALTKLKQRRIGIEVCLVHKTEREQRLIHELDRVGIKTNYFYLSGSK